MNTDNINKLIEVLEADNGSHFRMEQFVGFVPGVELPEDSYTIEYGRWSGSQSKTAQRFVDCKTTLCLAGHANILRMQEDGIDYRALRGQDYRGEVIDTDKAAAWLDIPSYDAYSLFYLLGGVEMDREDFDEMSDEFRRRAGIRVLEILRDEGHVSWNQAIQETADKDASA